VLTAAFDLALGFGCDPIVFVGADLAYTDGRPYCRGTTFEEDWAGHVARGVSLRQVWRHTLSARPCVPAAALDGREVATAAHLLEFRNWLLARIGEHPARRFVNATGAGTLQGAGLEQSDIASVLAAEPVRATAVRQALQRALAGGSGSPSSAGLHQAIREIMAVSGGSRVAPGTPAGATLQEWLAFGAPSTGLAEIHAALADAQRGWRAGATGERRRARSVAAAPLGPLLRMHAADRVARARAWLDGNAAVLDGVDVQTVREGRSTEQARAQAVRLVEDLLRFEAPLTASGTEPDPCASSMVPLSRRFAWTAEARPLVAALEECLLEVGHVVATGARADTRGAFWAGPVVPVLDGDASLEDGGTIPDAEPARESDALARLALSIEYVRAAGEAGCVRGRRLVAALAAGTTDPRLRLQPGAASRLALCGGRERLAVPLRIDAVMRALTGTIAHPAAAAGGEGVPLAPSLRLHRNSALSIAATKNGNSSGSPMRHPARNRVGMVYPPNVRSSVKSQMSNRE
jgi:hypothetical protein